MKKLSRRGLLRGGSALPVLLGGAGRAWATDRAAKTFKLRDDPHGVLDLPAGFSYQVLSRAGDPMSDGYRVPGNPDAMGMFTLPSGELALMRNHEVTPGDLAKAAFPPGQAPKEAYDATGCGGVTRSVLDPRTLAIKHSNLVLAGTHWNCAGGLSPWGWLSCEEIVIPNHGYVFLCPIDKSSVAPANPIKSYGRFRHEAATVDPATSIAYLTEDREDAAFYRFVPQDRARPFEGRLQALMVRDQPGLDTGRLTPGHKLAVSWVDIAEPDPADDNVRLQARERGAASFMRTEGLWLHGSDLYMCATSGGPIGRGQVFRLRHQPEQTAYLEVLAQATDTDVLDMPDNLTVSPTGQIYVAEDGPDGNYVRHITPDGRVVPFARNALSTSEFAGPCFTPDGTTMFVNMQRDGLTLAIRGPFDALNGVPTSAQQTSRDHAWSDGLPGLGAGLAVLTLAAFARRARTSSSE